MSESIDMEEVASTASGHQLDRRSLLRAGAIRGAAGMVAVGAPVFAQDGTPVPAGEAQEGDEPLATPEAAALPAIPPEIEQYANDWPMAQHDYEATRHAVGSTIDSSNVGELGVAWELPLDASSGFGAITSNPIVVGDRVYLIDNEGNMQSINRETGEVNWRVDRIREDNVVLVRGDPSNPDVPTMTRVIPLEPCGRQPVPNVTADRSMSGPWRGGSTRRTAVWSAVSPLPSASTKATAMVKCLRTKTPGPGGEKSTVNLAPLRLSDETISVVDDGTVYDTRVMFGK